MEKNVKSIINKTKTLINVSLLMVILKRFTICWKIYMNIINENFIQYYAFNIENV